jgi:hypothetical protein
MPLIDDGLYSIAIRGVSAPDQFRSSSSLRQIDCKTPKHEPHLSCLGTTTFIIKMHAATSRWRFCKPLSSIGCKISYSCIRYWYLRPALCSLQHYTHADIQQSSTSTPTRAHNESAIVEELLTSRCRETILRCTYPTSTTSEHYPQV